MILSSFLVPDRVVRVVFASVALGMGVDFHSLNTIIHYGAPSSIEDYFQESGRGGRSGDSANSIIYWAPRDCPNRKEPQTQYHHEQIEVRKYLENTTVCRRVKLLEHFNCVEAKPGQDPSLCCDICSASGLAT